MKICGIMSTQEGLAALDAGADYLGFVFYPPSSRLVTRQQAAAIVATCRREAPLAEWKAVGVFVDAPWQKVNEIAESCGFDCIQLSGAESPEYCKRMARPVIKAVRLSRPGEAATGSPLFGEDDTPRTADSFGAERLLIDSHVKGRYGGTGKAYDWARARTYAATALLAGGLRPDNVAEAIAAARPWGVDVSTGVERDGRKDPALVRAFIEAAKSAP